MEAKVKLSNIREENQLLKVQLQKYHVDDHNSKGQMAYSIEETKKTIFGLRSQIEEVKKIEVYLTSQIQDQEDICQRKELEILSIKGDLDKTVAQLKTNSRLEKSVK